MALVVASLVAPPLAPAAGVALAEAGTGATIIVGGEVSAGTLATIGGFWKSGMEVAGWCSFTGPKNGAKVAAGVTVLAVGEESPAIDSNLMGATSLANEVQDYNDLVI